MRLLNFQKKNENPIFTRRRFKYQKNTPFFVTIKNLLLFMKLI
jgi:hypothetical protein